MEGMQSAMGVPAEHISPMPPQKCPVTSMPKQPLSAQARTQRIQELQALLEARKKKETKAKADVVNPDHVETLPCDLSPIARTHYGVAPAPMSEKFNVFEGQIEEGKPAPVVRAQTMLYQADAAGLAKPEDETAELLKAKTRRLNSFALEDAAEPSPPKMASEATPAQAEKGGEVAEPSKGEGEPSAGHVGEEGAGGPSPRNLGPAFEQEAASVFDQEAGLELN